MKKLGPAHLAVSCFDGPQIVLTICFHRRNTLFQRVEHSVPMGETLCSNRPEQLSTVNSRESYTSLTHLSLSKPR